MADKQTQNPFDDFQPSWLKKAQAKSFESQPAARPAAPSADDDILFQELIAPLRTTNTPVSEPTSYNTSNSYNNYNNSTSDPYSVPIGVPNYFATPSTTVEPSNYLPTPEIAPIAPASALISSEKPSKTVKNINRKTAKPPRSKGWWTRELLILAVVVMVIVFGYIGFVELQGSQRTANSLAAKDLNSIAHFPNSYGMVLTSDEYNKFAIDAANNLDNIDKYACYHTSSSGLVVQSFYSEQLEKQNYSSIDLVSQNSYQNWGWLNKSQNGVVLTTYSVGWFDTGLFNRVAPGETVFCVFTGKMSSQTGATVPAPNTNGNAPAPAPASGGGGGSSTNTGDNPPSNSGPIKAAPSTAPPNQPTSAPTANSQTKPQGTPAAGRGTPTVPPTPTKPPLPTPTTNPLDKGA